MSYVSLDPTEPFLKCFDVIAEDKSCIISDTVLYFSGKAGKGFMTVTGLAAGMEVLALNVSMLTEDLTLNFVPSTDVSAYLLCFDEISNPARPEDELPAMGQSVNGGPVERMHSAVSITDAAHGRIITYPRERSIRSLVVRVRKSSLDKIIHDFDCGVVQSIIQSAGNAMVSWPMTFKYRLLISEFMDEIVQHPFREVFTVRNVSLLTEYLFQQFFVMNKLDEDGNQLSKQDTQNLSKVEQHLCSNYKKEFPGIEKLSRISTMSPTSLKTKFKKYYGDTLFGYYQKNKLEHARKLLDNKVPVKVVATEIGYSNPSHFTLAFKKEYGFSPWHYLNPQ